MRWDPAEMPWHRFYPRLVEAVLPRPIAWVSTVDREGRPNLAPFSFFNAVSAHPPLLAFVPALDREGREKDTLRNLRATGECVVALVSERTAPAANATAARLPRGESEFLFAGLTPRPAEKVAAPLVEESPVQMECRLREILSFGDAPGAGRLCVVEVVLLHARDEALDEDGRIDPARARPVARLGGRRWCRLGEIFEMPPPPEPSD